MCLIEQDEALPMPAEETTASRTEPLDATEQTTDCPSHRKEWTYIMHTMNIPSRIYLRSTVYLPDATVSGLMRVQVRSLILGVVRDGE